MADIGINVIILGTAEARRNIGAVQSDINGLSRTIENVSGVTSTLGRNLTSVGQALVGVGRTMTIAVTAPILAAGVAAVNAGIEFESAFAGVAKTVEGVADSAGNLTTVGQQIREEFRELAFEVPMSTNELAKLGEVVGQLGVSSQDVTAVTETIAMLGETTNMSAEDAANALIRFKNILLGTGGDIEDFVRRAGSAVVALGNASVSTESEILNLTLRLAAAGDRAKFTAPEILAWATTISDLGVRAESGGTAVSRAINEMFMAIQSGSDNVSTFASVFGETADGLNLFEAFADDASAATLHFIDALYKGIDAGTVSEQMLIDMGLSGTRTQDVLGRLGDATDIFKKNLEISNREWERGLALQEEFNKRAATVESQIQILKNVFTDLGITIFDLVRDDLVALVDTIGGLVEQFKELDPEVQKFIAIGAIIAAAIGPVLIVVGGLIAAIGTIITTIAALASGVGLAGIAIVGLGGLLAAAFSPEIIGVINNIKDAILDLFDVGEGAIGGGLTEEELAGRERGSGPERQRAQQRASDPSFFEELRAMLPQITIPQNVIDTVTKFQAAFMTASVVVRAAIEAIVSTVSTTLAPMFGEVFDEMTEMLASFGFTWEDVGKAVLSAIGMVAIAIGVTLLVAIGLVIAVIGGLASAISTFIGYWNDAGAAVGMFVEGIMGYFISMAIFFAGIFNTIVGGIGLVGAVIGGQTDVAEQKMAQLQQGLGQIAAGFVGMWKYMAEIVLSTVSLIITGVTSLFAIIISLVGGFVETFLSFFGNLYASLTGDTDNALSSIAEKFGTMKDSILATMSSFVEGVTGFFQNLYNTLIGHSIVPDMVTGILSEFSKMKDQAIELASSLVDTVIGVFEGLASRAGEILSDIFGGGGSSAVSIDTQSLDAAKASIESIRESLITLQGQITATTQMFVMSFVAVVSQQSILLVQTMINQWTMFSATLAAILASMSLQWSVFTLTTTANVINFITLTVQMFTDMGMRIKLVLQEVTSAFQSAINSIILSLSRLVTKFAEIIGTTTDMGNAIQTAMYDATNAVQVLIGAYRMLGAQALLTSGQVANANANIAATSGAAVNAVTSSPTLTLQHPFEDFAAFLQNTDFSFNMDMGNSEGIMGMLNQATQPTVASTTTTIDQSTNFGDINASGIQDTRNLADEITRRTQMARY